MVVLHIQSFIKTDSRVSTYTPTMIFKTEKNSFYFIDNGSKKKIVISKEVIVIITINNCLFTYLQQYSYYWVSKIFNLKNINLYFFFIEYSWTLILYETVKRVVTYNSLRDLQECYGLWNSIEVPLKICQTAAFLEVKTP